MFAKITQDQANGIVFGTGSMMFNQRARIGAAIIAPGCQRWRILRRRFRTGFSYRVGRTCLIFPAAQ